MTGNNGHAPKRFGETRSRTILCVQRVSGALPLTSRGQFFAAAETARKAKWVPLCPACHVCPEFATTNVQAIGLHLCDFACE